MKLRSHASPARRALRLVTVLFLVAVASVGGATPAFAHGEDKQPPNLRTRTVHFYDVQFSNPNIKVGDEFTIKGQMYVSAGWPDGVVNPDITQLTVVAPGPVILIKDRKISGQFISQSMQVEKGHSYPFELTVEARRAGNWHLHPMLAVKGAGGLIGPGQEITVAADPTGAPFTNDVTLADGKTVDLETYNVGESVVWHLLYLIPGVLFLVYWFAKPLMPRLRALLRSDVTPDDLVTKKDVKVSVVLGVVMLALTGASLVYGLVKWPHTLPLQVQNTAHPQGQVLTGAVTSELIGGNALYKEADDSITGTMRLRNNGAVPVQLSYIEVGNLVFDPTPKANTDTAGVLSADGPLTLAPGEQRDLKLRLVSRGLHDHAIIPGAEVTSVIGGLMVFSGPDGSRTLSEVSVPVLKEFVVT